jgi:exopolyphosphatase/pppGpp-phosphohydrolase
MNHPEVPPASDDEREARRQYIAIRAAVVDGARLTILHIGQLQTVLAMGTNREPAVVLALAIGSATTAAEQFRQDPPAPIEMENAIMVVEDEVTRAREAVAGSALHTMDRAIRQIALLAGVAESSEMALSLEAVERTFDRYSGVVLGRPAASEGLPAGGTFAATLLILRELMHHVKFAAITIRT